MEYRAYTNDGMIAIGDAPDLGSFLTKHELFNVTGIEIYVEKTLVYRY